MGKEKTSRDRPTPTEICMQDGHVGEWVTSTYTYANWIGDHIHKEWIEEERTRWTRKCARCGATEIHEAKPKDLVEREEREKRQKEEYKKKVDDMMRDVISAIENHVFEL